MDITDISSLISLVLAISLASERLVTLIKTLWPWLAGNQISTEADNPKPDKLREVTVMIIAFLAAWLTASFLNGKPDLWGFITIGQDPGKKIYNFFIGLLTSGGSAFWSNLLGYTNAVKNIKVQSLTTKKAAFKAQYQTGANEKNGTASKASFVQNPIQNRNIADNIEGDVKQIIIDVSHLTGSPSQLNSRTKLSQLGFNGNMCNELAQRLNAYVKFVNPNAHVNDAEITASMSVQDIINLITKKVSI